MSSSSVARSEKILARLAREDHLSEAAKQWLTVSLDPFHDNPTNCTGLPDSQTGDSVVQFIKSSLTIKKPDGITTGTWDCHAVLAPFFSNSGAPLQFVTGYASDNNSSAIAFDSTQSSRPTGPLTIVAYPTGQQTIDNFPNPFAGGNSGSASKTTNIVNLNANFTTGDYRVIAQGFEVVNTTAVLNQQGLCTVYRSPVPPMASSTVHGIVRLNGPGGEVEVTGDVQLLPLQNIPNQESQALLLPGTKQWHAKEGCYVVSRINTDDSDVVDNSWLQPCFDLGGKDNVPGDSGYYIPPLSFKKYGVTTPVNVPSMRPIQWANMDISGVFFSGLSLETTLTFNWNIYIERFPSITETDLVVLAKPSPEFCPMAFELYKAIAQNLPVGVMQKENGLGDWFRDAVSTAAEFIQPVAAMIPHPAAQMVSKAAGIASALTRRENDSPYIGNAKQEKLYLEPVGKKSANKAAKKEAKKEVKKEIKKEIKAVMPQRKKAGKR